MLYVDFLYEKLFFFGGIFVGFVECCMLVSFCDSFVNVFFWSCVVGDVDLC